MDVALFFAVAGGLAAAHFTGVAIGRSLGRGSAAIDAGELRACRAAMASIEGLTASPLMLTAEDTAAVPGPAADAEVDVTAHRLHDRDLTEFFGLEDDEDIFDLQTWELVPAQDADPEFAHDTPVAEEPVPTANLIPELSRRRRPRRRRGRTEGPATTVITVPVGGEQLLLTIHD